MHRRNQADALDTERHNSGQRVVTASGMPGIQDQNGRGQRCQVNQRVAPLGARYHVAEVAGSSCSEVRDVARWVRQRQIDSHHAMAALKEMPAAGAATLAIPARYGDPHCCRCCLCARVAVVAYRKKYRLVRSPITSF
jgi:hypothetical protein